MLGVPLELIMQHGAVSEAVARAMADGALGHARAGIAVSVTGVAGPGGGSAEKPVGLVWLGLAESGKPTATERQIFPGDRAAIRMAAVARVFALIRARV